MNQNGNGTGNGHGVVTSSETMVVPFYRPSLTESEIEEVVDCLRSGWLTTGPKTKKFERDFADYVGQKHGVALNSCTAALHLALEAIGLKEGDIAVVPTMTFAATAEVVRYFNATPLLVDCREEDFNLDVEDAGRRLDGRAVGWSGGPAVERSGGGAVAILPVHYGGQIGDVYGVSALAKKYGLKVVEDAAHCCPAYYGTMGLWDHGTMGPQDYRTTGLQDHGTVGLWDGRTVGRSDGQTAGRPDRQTGGPPDRQTAGRADWLPVGAQADITCFSFYANKCITTGEGGMACTQNDQYAERMRVMSLHGISKDAWKRFTAEGSWYYEIVAPGFKYNLTDIASAIGIHQLRRADELHRLRTKWAALYTELLGDIEELILPRQLPDRIHSWHLYVIRLKLDRLNLDRAQVIEELKHKGITTSVHWMPLHMHPYYREKYGYRPEDFPVASRLWPEIITLPLYPGMREEEVRYVCGVLRGCVAKAMKGL